jgi:hypothetical protein
MEDGFDIRMRFRPRDLPEDLKPLVGQSQPSIPQRFRECLNAAVDLPLGQSHRSPGRKMRPFPK